MVLLRGHSLVLLSKKHVWLLVMSKPEKCSRFKSSMLFMSSWEGSTSITVDITFSSYNILHLDACYNFYKIGDVVLFKSLKSPLGPVVSWISCVYTTIILA